MGDGDGGHHLAGGHGLVVVRRLQHPAAEAHLAIFEGEPAEDFDCTGISFEKKQQYLCSLPQLSM